MTSVTVWPISLYRTTDELARDRALLSEEERRRASSFLFDRDKRRFVAAHAGLRRVLGEVLNCEPQSLDVTSQANVKPTLASGPAHNPRAHDDVHFNLTHCGEIAVVATTRVAPVGIDVEVVRDLPDMQAVAAVVFTDQERRQLGEVPSAQRSRAFFTGWTRKEAVIKATGEGFGADLSAFSVSLRPDEPAGFMQPPHAADGEHWHLRHVDLAPHTLCAVALAAATTSLEVDVVAATNGAFVC